MPSKTILLLKTSLPFIIALCCALSVFGQSGSKPSMRILFIPLDDRPPCLQFTIKMGMIGNAELVTPPKALLGRYTTAGQCSRIIEWLQQQNLKSFDAAIVSLDMLVYGGLVASRVFDVPTGLALQRVDVLHTLRSKAPKLAIYAQSVIMRLAPTADGKNDAYRADLSKWAEISVKTDEASKGETAALEKKIPAEGLDNYKQARQRNLTLNLKAVEYVRSGVINYLILSQDDAKPVGVHVADRLRLIDETNRLALTGKIAVQPGADEVSMLLLARAVNHYFTVSPTVKAIYSSATAAGTVMPFEDKPLRETVSFHIRATGSSEVQEEGADLLFYVFASRREPGSAAAFAAAIAEKIKQGRHVMVADIDPVGDVQGGDSVFTRELISRGLLPELNSYASWNTAANTIGTTLPQGIVFEAAVAKLLGNKSIAARVWSAQNWFTFHRVIDDCYFHGATRLAVNKYFGQEKLSSKILDEKTNLAVEQYTVQLLLQPFHSLGEVYTHKISGSRQRQVQCTRPANLSFHLPWNRTFEAEIDFDMACKVK